MERYLNIIRNLTTRVKEVGSENYPLISFGNLVLKVSEELVSTLVEKTDTYMFTNIPLQTIGTEPDYNHHYFK